MNKLWHTEITHKEMLRYSLDLGAQLYDICQQVKNINIHLTYSPDTLDEKSTEKVKRSIKHLLECVKAAKTNEGNMSGMLMGYAFDEMQKKGE